MQNIFFFFCQDQVWIEIFKNVVWTLKYMNVCDMSVIYEYKGVEYMKSHLPWQFQDKWLLYFLVSATRRAEFVELLIQGTDF